MNTNQGRRIAACLAGAFAERTGRSRHRVATRPRRRRGPWAEAHGYRHPVATRPAGKGRRRFEILSCDELFQLIRAYSCPSVVEKNCPRIRVHFSFLTSTLDLRPLASY